MLDCGMAHFHDKNIKEALIGLVPEEEENIEGMKFGEIIESVFLGVETRLGANGTSSLEDSVREDIAILKASPLIKESTRIVGLVFDISTGILTEVN
jgi:carbonic anhydrase